MRKQQVLRLALLVALLVLAVSPVYGQSDETQIVVPAGETLKLGLITDLTGPIAQMGLDIQQAAEIAVADKNADGGIQGFQVELVVEDDRCDAKEGTTVASRLASDPEIVAVVGPICSGPTIAASDVFEDAHIPTMSPSATRADLTNRGYTVLNRVAFSDGNQGRFAANYIYKVLGATKIAILHDNAAYGQGIAEVVQAEFEALGGEVVAFEGINVEDQDYRAVLTPLLNAAPDVIYFGGYQQQAVLLVTQKNDVGLEDAIFFSDDGTFAAAFIEGAGEAAEGSYATFANPPEATESTETFDAKYEEAYGVLPSELGPFHYHTYDAAMLLMIAIENASEVDADGNLVINREALVGAVREIEGYEGLTGTLTCSEIGECGTGSIGINIVEDGEWVAAEVPEDMMATEEAPN
jgi:branched-chain amino acid transport system substrate-binding protein